MVATLVMPVRSFDLFGAKISPMTKDELLALVKNHVARSTQCVIAYQNLHGMYVRMHDAAIDGLHGLSRTFVHIDGMPLVLLCRLRGIRATRAHRLTLVDWIWQLFELASRERWRVYYVGATDAVIERGMAAIRRRLPGLELAAHHGYFDARDPQANAALLDEIGAFRPDLVLVGMGMGRQERWIGENLAAIAPASVCTLGACMEYIAGAVRTPPRWSGPLGVEWLFRFAEDPRRFWRRYFVEPWYVLAHILAAMTRTQIEPVSADDA